MIGSRLTLRSILDFKSRRHALARRRRRTSRSLKAVHGINTTLRQTLGVLEIQPLDRSLARKARARIRRRGSIVELADLSLGVRGHGKLIEGEGGRVGSTEHLEHVVADVVVVALGLEAPLHGGWVVAQGKGERGEGGDLPLRHWVVVELGADVVEGS